MPLTGDISKDIPELIKALSKKKKYKGLSRSKIRKMAVAIAYGKKREG